MRFRWTSGECQGNVKSQSELDIGGHETCLTFLCCLSVMLLPMMTQAYLHHELSDSHICIIRQRLNIKRPRNYISFCKMPGWFGSKVGWFGSLPKSAVSRWRFISKFPSLPKSALFQLGQPYSTISFSWLTKHTYIKAEAHALRWFRLKQIITGETVFFWLDNISGR